MYYFLGAVIHVIVGQVRFPRPVRGRDIYGGYSFGSRDFKDYALRGEGVSNSPYGFHTLASG